jgi:hypothetical protein
MKAEHRHQLHTNLLADRMGRLVESMKSTPTRTSQLLWTLVLLSLAVIAAWQYLGYATRSDHSAQWTEVDVATHDPRIGPESLLKFEDDKKNKIRFNGTLSGRAAAFQVARLRLEDGLGLKGIASFRNEQAINNIKGALQFYTDLAPRCPDAPLLAQEALMGIAKAKESLIAVPAEDDDEKKLDFGTLDQARDAYQALVKVFPDSVLGKEAESRLKELKEKGVQIEEFYKFKLRAALKHPDLPTFPTPLDNKPAPETSPTFPPIPDFNLNPPTGPGSTAVPPETTAPGSKVVPPTTTGPGSTTVPPAATSSGSSTPPAKKTLPESPTTKKPTPPDKEKSKN